MLATAIAAIAAQCSHLSPGAVRIERKRASLVSVQEFRRDFDRHVEALGNVRRTFARSGAHEPVVIGIYPDDPDAVGMDNVRRQLAARLDEQRATHLSASRADLLCDLASTRGCSFSGIRSSRTPSDAWRRGGTMLSG
ncbi:MAG TPA: hypothetical protein VD887_03655 [Allosphingosinicella sp.]|nr:hypothetical protein [Allosphingosinicella sp.]